MCSTKGFDICLHCDEPLAIQHDPPVRYTQYNSQMPSRIRQAMNGKEFTEGSTYVSYYNVYVQDPYTCGDIPARCCESCASSNGIRFCPICEQSYVASREWYGHMADTDGHVRRSRSIIVCPDCSTSPDFPECVCSHPDCDNKVYVKDQNGDPYSSGHTIGAMSEDVKVLCQSCKHHQYVCDAEWCTKRYIDNRSFIRYDDDDNSYHFCSDACAELQMSLPRMLPHKNPKLWPYVAGCGCRVCSWFSAHSGEVREMGWAEPTLISRSGDSCDGCGCNSSTVEPVTDSQDPEGVSYLCHLCRMGNYFHCSSCDTTMGSSSYTEIAELNSMANADSVRLSCDTCLEDSSLVWMCDVSCNKWYPTFREECACGGIHPWNYTPSSFKFFACNEDHTKVPFLGIEIEVEAMRNRASRNSGARLTRSIAKDWSWCMHDGSLGDNGQMGFEIVTHPMTYNWFTENWANIKDLLTQLTTHGMRSWDSGRCGMHIHITRTIMSDAHQMRFLNFIYGSANLAMSIGGRRYNDPAMERYAPFDAERRSDFLKYKVRRLSNPGADGHYVAVNANKPNTLEARWMRGTLSPMSFRKNVEFIQSVWDFTRKFGHTSANEMNYITWLRGVPESKRFPNVLHHIEHNYITRR